MPYDIYYPNVKQYIAECIVHFKKSPTPLDASELVARHASLAGIPICEVVATGPGRIITELYVKHTVKDLADREWADLALAEMDIKEYFNTHPFHSFFVQKLNAYVKDYDFLASFAGDPNAPLLGNLA